jgi:hypothetical protein
MPQYRILYLLPEHAARFRDKPPKKAPYSLREGHYEEGPEVEAQTPYELWLQLQEQPETAETPRAIKVGDAIRTTEGELLVCNFWGFDKAEWWTPVRADETTLGEPEHQTAGHEPALVAAASS